MTDFTLEFDQLVQEVEPRELIDENEPDGYLESERDWIAHNHDVVIKFLELAQKIQENS